jgi:hypothetical protein
MREIVAGAFVPVDGMVESPGTRTGPHFSPEVGQVIGSLIACPTNSTCWCSRRGEPRQVPVGRRRQAGRADAHRIAGIQLRVVHHLPPG